MKPSEMIAGLRSMESETEILDMRVSKARQPLKRKIRLEALATPNGIEFRLM
ncbi:MAG: hypothetical protein SNJ55_03035 [Chloroherpetonaceae bacterium]